MKFDIPFIVSVEAASIEDARKIAAEVVEVVDAKSEKTEVYMADDSATTKYNSRVVLLHPEDTHSEYNEEEYNSSIDKLVVSRR